MFSLHICFLHSRRVHASSKVSNLRLSLLIATLLTTGSTAGILLLPLALSVGLLKRGGKVRIAISLSLLIVFIVVLVNFSVIIAELAKINPSLFSKLTDAACCD